MKNKTRFSVLILALVMMCLCLSGCDELDTMREYHAFWTETGKFDSITYDGTTYRKLDAFDTPDPMYKSSEQMVFVTEDDVPVLLSEECGTTMMLTEDKKFMQGMVYTSSYRPGSGLAENNVYCRVDIYDEIKSRVNSGIEYTLYGYEYWVDYESKSDDGTYRESEYEYYYLKKDEIDAVNKVLNTVKPVDDSQVAYEYAYILGLDKVSSDKYFGKEGYEIYKDNAGDYYLAQYSIALETYTSYKVPDDLRETFDEFTKHSEYSNF